MFSILPAMAARARGRSGVAWFFLSLVMSPLFALIAVLVMRPIEPEKPWTASAPSPGASYRRDPVAPAQKKCPDCAEMVLADARICWRCRHEFAAPPKQLQREIVGFGLAKPAAPVFPGEAVASEEATRGCRVCAKTIPAAARVCRHCGARQETEA